MILKALYDYYYRCKASLPTDGMEDKQIAFLLVIDKAGNFLRFEDRRKEDKKSAASFRVKRSEEHTSNTVAGYLYGNSSYVFGYSNGPKNKKETNDKHFDAFRSIVNEIYNRHPEHQDMQAVHTFYQQSKEQMQQALQTDSLWKDVSHAKSSDSFSFLIQGDIKIVAEKEELIDLTTDAPHGKETICLVSGEHGVAVRTAKAIKLPGSQYAGKLLSFQRNSGYDSYGKEQCGNAPICTKSEYAFTTALKHLLDPDSRNKFSIGKTTFLFWASSDNEVSRQVETSVFNMVGSDDDKDNPDKNILQVEAVFKSIWSGKKMESDEKFYILGLTQPDRTRISVVYWSETPLKTFASLISRHFDDMEIYTYVKPKPYKGLYSMVGSTTMSGKPEDALRNLPSAVANSIFKGQPYPYTLFTSCLRRIRATQEIRITRAAILKAYLNRIHDDTNKKIEVMLDEENTNQAYLCGRLFAVLDKLQDDANHIRSIKERYMNAASATPAAVFATILKLSSHHTEKLDDRGMAVYYDKLKREIIDKLSPDGFPVHLDLQDQGRFFVGYYHQMQWIYTPKKEKQPQE